MASGVGKKMQSDCTVFIDRGWQRRHQQPRIKRRSVAFGKHEAMLMHKVV